MTAASTQSVLLASTTGEAVPALTQAAMLVAYAPPATEGVAASQALILAAMEGRPLPAASQLALLVAFRTGGTENRNNRAWSFDMDGHSFYVLTIGEEGTYLYDELTGQWSRWRTTGLTSWNMEYGLVWKDKIIAADQSNPVIWAVKFDGFLDDDFKPITRVVTGALSSRNRDFVGVYGFRLTASVGQPSEVDATISLRYSDDQGRTFIQSNEFIVAAGETKQELTWLSLGLVEPPVKVFEITDTGALVRLSGADADIDEQG